MSTPSQNFAPSAEAVPRAGAPDSALPVPIPTWKRFIDILFCLPALPLLAGLTLFFALFVRRVSPGPIFFRQERVGCRGRRFMCFKFRTMKVGADAGVHRQHFAQLVGSNAPMAKIEHGVDNRLIFGGRFLRASGLDELPQIINVLRGEMSLVGPRPCIPYEYELYQPWQRERFETHPGLTGLWQVSGKNRTTFERMIHLDIEYVRTKSWWLDLTIISLTPFAILAQLAECRPFASVRQAAAAAFAALTAQAISNRATARGR